LEESLTDLAVINGMIFDGESADPRPGTIFVSDGLITEIGDEPVRDGRKVLDANGGMISPGLIDAHFHAYAADVDALRIEASPLSYIALVAAQRLHAALTRGFTTVRDVAGGDPGLARAINTGLISSPGYLYTGPGFSQTGGHGDNRPSGLDLHTCNGPHLIEVVDGVENLRRAVRERLREGAHAIKIFASGGVLSPTDPIRNPQYSAEEIRVVTEEAARHGSYVAAHAYSAEAITHAVTHGVRSIEHGNLLDEPTARLMAERDTFLVPTLAAYEAMDRRGAELGLSAESQRRNREVLDSGRKALELARAAGVSIGWGSDLMGVLEDEQLSGLRTHVEVEGVLDTLRSVTSVNAALLRRPDLGRIEVGARADLVIYDGSPLDDPSLLWDTQGERRMVVSGGALVGPSA
jgi:imidazolonepropionase-like amidohydrolase